MKETLVERLNALSVKGNVSMLKALRLMDQKGLKSLLLLDDNDKFISIISIGDIQRAIIRNCSLDIPVKDIMRNLVTTAYVGESEESIRKKIFDNKTEFMPVLSENNDIVNIYLWDDFFQKNLIKRKLLEDIPVVIMAGGYGTRLKPLTNIIPKPLIPIDDKTIIEIIMDNFIDAGLSRFFLTVNYKKEMIEYYFSQLNSNQYKISYISEDLPLGTAGSLKLLKDHLKGTFFVSNCDIIIDGDYADYFDYHKKNNNQITIIAAFKHINIPYGTITAGVDGLLETIEEKPTLNYMINTGMYILEPEVLDYINDNQFIHITEIIEQLRQEGKRVGVYPINETSWTDIGEWPEYYKVIRKL